MTKTKNGLLLISYRCEVLLLLLTITHDIANAASRGSIISTRVCLMVSLHSVEPRVEAQVRWSETLAHAFSSLYYLSVIKRAFVSPSLNRTFGQMASEPLRA